MKERMIYKYKKAIPGKGVESPFPTRPAWSIYCEESQCGYNRSLVSKLLSYVLSGFAAPDGVVLPFPPREATEWAIVSGAFAVLNPIGKVTPVVEPDFLEGLQLVKKDHLLQCELDEYGCPIEGLMIEWTLDGAKWSRQEWKAWGTASPEKVGPAIEYAEAALFVRPAPPTPYYYAQHTYKPLEEVYRDVRRRQRTGASKSVVQVAGGNIDNIVQQFSDEEASTVITDTETRSYPPATTQVDQMIHTMEKLEDAYHAALCVVQDDTPDRPSGVDRVQRMMSMLAEISNIRDALKEIYGQFGIAVSFDEIIVLAPAERAAEKAHLDSLHDTFVLGERVLSDEEYRRRLRALA